MELRSKIQQNNPTISLDSFEININQLLDNKYNLLLNYLSDNNIKTTNDLKKLTNMEYTKLKMEIPTIPGVGDEKTKMYITKLNLIREKNNDKNHKEEIIGKHKIKIENISTQKINNKVSILLNFMNYDGKDLYDLREIDENGDRGKGLYIKKEVFEKIIDDYLHVKAIENISEITESKTSDSTIEPNSLKTKILSNETKLYDLIGNEFGKQIKLFVQKIKSFNKDGDIVKFLNNSSILEVKKKQYEVVHSLNHKTAMDIMNEHDKSNMEYSKITDYKEGDLLNTITICAIANNFNMTIGMYYNKKDNILLLKSQFKNDTYNDNWVLKDEKIEYSLQNEKQEKYEDFNFSHVPNQICRDIIRGENTTTRTYLFIRYNKKEDYIFAGEFKPVKFSNNNKSIILEKISN